MGFCKCDLEQGYECCNRVSVANFCYVVTSLSLVYVVLLRCFSVGVLWNTRVLPVHDLSVLPLVSKVLQPLDMFQDLVQNAFTIRLPT